MDFISSLFGNKTANTNLKNNKTQEIVVKDEEDKKTGGKHNIKHKGRKTRRHRKRRSSLFRKRKNAFFFQVSLVLKCLLVL